MRHTHGLITSKFLRNCYARELREHRIAGKLSNDLRWGMESGIWAVQKAFYRMNPIRQLRAWVYRRRRRVAL